MKVWKQGIYAKSGDIFSPAEEDPIRLKVVYYGGVFGSKLTSYFESRNYGSGVKEIFYREYCLKEELLNKEVYYGSRKKNIECPVVLDFEKVLEMDNTEYGKYIVGLYLDRTTQLSELNIKDFDLDKFILDLKGFFKNNELL